MRYSAYSLVKRSMDLSLGCILLGVTCPVFAAAALMIKAESPGPVFYVHDRIGRGGRRIKVYKFRSMKTGADDLEAVLNDEDLERYYQEYKLTDDPRVTETGRMLRRTSLDELPQLINVLQGSMSLVGPRPVMEQELEFYSDEEKEQLLSVKPGITGFWQVSGRNDATYQSGRRQKLELYYVSHASLLTDALILLRTPMAVFRKKGV